MAYASEEQPLCIVIDSLDQLTDEDGARRFLEWLPCKLPAHVHMIISTLPAEGGCMQRLKTLGMPAEQFLEVNKLFDDTLILYNFGEKQQLRLTRNKEICLGTAAKPCMLNEMLESNQSIKCCYPW